MLITACLSSFEYLRHNLCHKNFSQYFTEKIPKNRTNLKWIAFLCDTEDEEIGVLSGNGETIVVGNAGSVWRKLTLLDDLPVPGNAYSHLFFTADSTDT